MNKLINTTENKLPAHGKKGAVGRFAVYHTGKMEYTIFNIVSGENCGKRESVMRAFELADWLNGH